MNVSPAASAPQSSATPAHAASSQHPSAATGRNLKKTQVKALDPNATSLLGCGFDVETHEPKKRVFTGDLTELRAIRDQFFFKNEDDYSYSNRLGKAAMPFGAIHTNRHQSDTRVTFSMNFQAQRVKRRLINPKLSMPQKSAHQMPPKPAERNPTEQGKPAAAQKVSSGQVVSLRSLGNSVVNEECLGGRITLFVTLDFSMDVRHQAEGWAFQVDDCGLSKMKNVAPLTVNDTGVSASNQQALSGWLDVFTGENAGNDSGTLGTHVEIKRTGGNWDASELESIKEKLQSGLNRRTWGEALATFISCCKKLAEHVNNHPEDFEVLSQASCDYSALEATIMDETLNRESKWRDEALANLQAARARQFDHHKMSRAVLNRAESTPTEKRLANTIITNSIFNITAIDRETARIRPGVTASAPTEQNYDTEKFCEKLKPVDLISEDTMDTALLEYKDAQRNRALDYMAALRDTAATHYRTAQRVHKQLRENPKTEIFLHTGGLFYEQNLAKAKLAEEDAAHNLNLIDTLHEDLALVTDDADYQAVMARLRANFRFHTDSEKIPHLKMGSINMLWQMPTGFVAGLLEKGFGGNHVIDKPDLTHFPESLEPGGPKQS